MVTILTDDDIRARLTPERAVVWVRDAVRAAHDGELTAPPRVHAEFPGGRLVFTTGALWGQWYGYRSYDTFDNDPGEQLTSVHDWHTGQIRGLAVGSLLGPRRVGAIGAVAADLLATPHAATLGMLGTGTQAWNQLWAIRAVRSLHTVRVFSRNEERRTEFAAQARDVLGLDVTATTSAEGAVRDSEIVVLATSSGRPVVDASWIREGAYVTTLGPKQVQRSEFGPDLVARADVTVSDSLAQLRAYDPPNVLAGTPQEERLRSLGSVLAGNATGGSERDETVVFCSVGLAGTEAYLLDRLLTSAD